MYKNLFKFIIILILTSLKSSFAQVENIINNDGSKTDLIQWANLGFGGADDLKEGRFINYGLSYHWKAKSLTYIAGINYSAKLLSGPAISNFNAGIGKSIIKRLYVAAVTGGPGIIWCKDFKTTISLNAKAQAVFTPIKNLGVGIELFSNINRVNNLVGLRLIIHLNDNKY